MEFDVEQYQTRVEPEKRLKKAVGYIRVSTEQQAMEDRYGVDAQRKAIAKYALENGYEIVKLYIDEISGVKEDRPEMNRIMFGDDVTNPPFEAVIVFKNDRIARDTKLYFYYLFTLEKKGIKLISTQEDFAEGNEFANIYRALMLFVAEQERKNITMRTTNGRNVKASIGGYAGGKPPYGYKAVNGKLVIVTEEAKGVRLMFALRDQGLSMRAICQVMYEKGYMNAKGYMFDSGTISSMLENRPFYAGCYRYGKGAYWMQGQHRPILDEDITPYLEAAPKTK